MKEKVLKLYSEGKSIKQIAEILHIHYTNVRYHLFSNNKKIEVNRARGESRKLAAKNLRLEHGGKCCKCGYSKCLDALHFHHINPKEKEDDVLHILYRKNITKAKEEAKKCILVCANCHAEIHYNLNHKK